MFLLWSQESREGNLSKSKNQTSCWLFDICSFFFSLERWFEREKKKRRRIMSLWQYVHMDVVVLCLNSSTVTYVHKCTGHHYTLESMSIKGERSMQPKLDSYFIKMFLFLWIGILNRSASVFFPLRCARYYQCIAVDSMMQITFYWNSCNDFRF